MISIPTCNQCGLCCRSQSSPPIMPDEFSALPPALQAEINAYLDGPLFNDSDPCLWMDRSSGRCRHHEHRPGVCRDYPLSGPNCREQRVEAGLTIEGWPVVDDEQEPGGAA